MYQAFKTWGGGVILAMFGPLGVLTTILAHQDSLHGAFWWLIGGFLLLTAVGVVWLIVAMWSWYRTHQPPRRVDDKIGVLWPTWGWYVVGVIAATVFVLGSSVGIFLSAGSLQYLWRVDRYVSLFLLWVAVGYGPAFWLVEVCWAGKTYERSLRHSDLEFRRAELQHLSDPKTMNPRNQIRTLPRVAS